MSGTCVRSASASHFQHPQQVRGARVDTEMVQLSPSPVLDVSPPSECSEEVAGRQGSPKTESPPTLSSLQLALAASTTTYQGYETYIEDGLICLKHKIRNMDKKRLKLEDYRRRLKNGETLNQDQMEAAEKYEEVIHNLAFAKDLQKTLGSLSQDLLKAQRKAVRREQTARAEAEKRRLATVLQAHYILQSLQQEHVRKDFRSGLNRAPFLSAGEVERLLDLAALLGCKRDESMSLEDQMEQASSIYWDLMEGRDKPVAGTSYKHMKEQLARLMDCGYFDHIPVPHNEDLDEAEDLVTRKTEGLPKAKGSISDLSKLMTTNEVPTREFLNRRYLPETDYCGRGQPDQTKASNQNWKADLMALKQQQEPPDSWEMEFAEKPSSQKLWRGAATFVPKEQGAAPRPTDEPKQRRGKKSKVQQDAKTAVKAEVPVEVFSSPLSLPQDPVLRKQQLQDLMKQIQGSFSFMQDSVLDREGSPTTEGSTTSRPSPGPSTPTAQREPKTSPAPSLPKTMHSTPLPARLLPMDTKSSLTNGDQSLNNSDLDISADEENNQLSESEGFSSPPLYCRESTLSTSLVENTPDQTPVSQAGGQSPGNGAASATPAHQAPPFSSPPSSHALSMATAPFQAVHTVFKVNAPLPPRTSSDLKSDASTFSDSYNLSFTTASTQTPPDLGGLDPDHLQPVTSYQSEGPVSNGCQVYLSPSHAAGAFSRSGQPYYSRGSVRGGFEGYRTGLRSPGGSFIPQSHTAREVTPVLYGVRETGYQQSYKRGTAAGGQRNHSRAAWSDSSQVSSPERDGETFASVDSGHGDSRCATPIDAPVGPQGPALMPVHVYPLPQQMRVAFSAARTVNFAPGTLDQTIVFDLLHSNLGETFDAHLGRFTCPADGTYVFIFHILKLAVNVPLYVNLMRNEEVMVSAYANDGAPDHETASNHAVLQLYQGDQVWLRLHRGAIYGSSWKYSTFSGYLLYQD
ncbi:caprin-2 [Megalops cyprinoides]|uniref:caprin-2 n=1 Tax=Megalops cyprinoides TaxID=118141 RepID=UPI001863FADA|nr:caprin-2 [Megalops cyprinoides]